MYFFPELLVKLLLYFNEDKNIAMNPKRTNRKLRESHDRNGSLSLKFFEDQLDGC